MRLINVKTLKLERFLENNVPAYAILSHTWKDDEELSFRDIEEGRIDKPGIGSVKLQRCCKQAEKDGLGYAWIDTCCFDKTDSVELGEAINSMFRWYKKANICYAYLSDVPGDDNPRNPGAEFRKSRWFKRGWTLQELLAPQRLQFYSSDWRWLGTKGELCTIVERITGISNQFLLGIAEPRTASVAQRMSWAAQRETTREEDMAYCLLGIFGVSIPMIYGEGGEQAFFRLQEQIMRTTRDDSILAWGLSLTAPISSYATKATPGRILAAAPLDFANCKQIISREQSSSLMHSLDISGGSLRIYLSLLTTSAGETIGLLKCGLEHEEQQVVGIPLSTATSTSSDEYFRPRGSHLVLLPMAVANASPKLIHIKNDSQSEISVHANRRYWLYSDGFAETDLDLIEVAPRSCWDKEQALIVSTIESDANTTCRILARFRHKEEGSQDFVIVLEIEQQESCVEPKCYVMICSRDTLLEDLAENMRYMAQKVSGRRSASNEILNLHVAWESVARQPIIRIKPHVTSNPPEATFDATLELQILDLQLEFVKVIEEEGKTNIENEELEQEVKEGSTRLVQMKRELEVVEDELKKLTEKKRMLVERGTNGAQEIFRLNERHAEIKKRKEDIFKRRLYTQQRWNEIRHNNYGGYDYEPEAMNCWTLLRYAAENGHEAIVKQLLNIGHFDIDSKDTKSGQTPLSWAAANGHEAVVQLLLKKGAKLELKDSKYGRTPLSQAARNGHVAIVQLLLEKGAKLESKDSNYGQTALSRAARNGHMAVVQLLLKKGADFESKDEDNWTPLLWAAKNGYEAVVQLLLEKGAKLDSKDSKYRRTPLLLAAGNGQVAVVQLLLEKGAKLELKDSKYGQTALSQAARNGHVAVVQLLLEKGADFESMDGNNWTPLLWAAKNGYKSVVKLLLENGADFESNNKDDQTPLIWAARNGHKDIVRLLLGNGADFESKDEDNWTPLLWAAKNGHKGVVELLLENGAEIESKDKDNWTPLLWAAENGDEAMVRLLLKKGAKLESKDSKYGRTPLSYAAANGHEAAVKLLLENKAEVNSKSNSSRTPLSYASRKGHEAVVKLLTTGQISNREQE